MRLIFLIVFILHWSAFQCKERHLQKGRQDSDKNELVLNSGLKLKFSEKRSAALLLNWAKDIDLHGGTVSHTTAVQRESHIVNMINSGQLSFGAYEDYQRLAAGTGNVDSARLLMQYGIGGTVKSLMEASGGRGNTVSHRAHVLAMNCNATALQAAFASLSLSSDSHIHGEDEVDDNLHNGDRGEDDDYDWTGLHADLHLEDGTTLLVVAAYSGCLNVVILLINEGANVELAGANGVTPLMAAAGSGHAHVIEVLVKSGHASVHIKHKFSSTTALHMAAEMVHASAIRTLCQLGADALAVTSTGGTPLHTLAQGGLTELRKFHDTKSSSSSSQSGIDKRSQESELSNEENDKRIDDVISAFKDDCKISLDILMNDDTTALYLASQYGNTALVRALLRGGANPSFSMPFTKYKGGSQLATPGGTLPDGSSVFDKGFLLNSEAGNGAEAIHAAAEEGHADTVLALIRGGADPNSLAMAVTPLHLAAQYNRPDVARVLIQEGNCDVNKRSYTDGATALYYAAGHGYTAVVREILSSPQVNMSITQSRSGGFPLFYAAIMNQAATFTQLVQAGADVRQKCPDGHTALSGAISALCVGCVQALLEHKDVYNLLVDERMGNKDQYTSLLAAVVAPKSPKRDKIVNLALQTVKSSLLGGESSRFVRFVDTPSLQDGATALHYAARQGDVFTCSILLDVGANVNLRMKDPASFSPTPLYLAIHSGNSRLVQLLLQRGADPEAGLDHPSNITPLLAAIDKGDTKSAKILLRGVSVQTKEKSSGKRKLNVDSNTNINTNAHTGIDNNNINSNSIDSSIDSSSIGSSGSMKADPNKGLPNGGIMQSPLLFAVVRSRAEIVKDLLNAGAYCNVIVATPSSSKNNHQHRDRGGGRQDDGETLVDIARRKRDFDVLQALMMFPQCDPDTVRSGGRLI